MAFISDTYLYFNHCNLLSLILAIYLFNCDILHVHVNLFDFDREPESFKNARKDAYKFY